MFEILGGIYVDYKKEIIEMIQKIDNQEILAFIYGILIGLGLK